MIYLTNNAVGVLTLNVNNNTKEVASNYLLKFTHILSQQEYEYTIDTSNDTQYISNDRYCQMNINLQVQYEGEYQLQVYFNSNELVYTGIVIVGEQVETFIPYTSDNENNENYIYIED